MCKTEKKTQKEFHDIPWQKSFKKCPKVGFPTRQAILGGLQKASGGDVQNKAAAKGLVYSKPKRKVEKSYLCLEEWWIMMDYSLFWSLRYCRSGKLQVFVAGIQTYLWTCGRLWVFTAGWSNKNVICWPINNPNWLDMDQHILCMALGPGFIPMVNGFISSRRR